MADIGQARVGDGYHGIFAKLRELNIYDDSTAEDLYGPRLAGFYNRFVGDFVDDIPLFESMLADSGPDARVLDLACGAGRIGIALARNGTRVDGIELSPHMLALVDSNLAGEPAEIRERLEFIQGDMSKFALEHRYDLIVIGVTSISLLLQSAQRRSLFACAREHLKPGGRLVFDVMDFDDGRWRKFDHFQDVWARETDEGQDFAIVGQRFFPDEGVFSFNVYRELVGWDGETIRTIGTSIKALLTSDQLKQELTESGLAMVDEFRRGDLRFFVSGVPL